MRTGRLSLGIVVLAVSCAFNGCGYPQVSPKSYELTKALYSACNRRNEEHLARVAEVLDSTKTAGDISDRESKWLHAIIDKARAGEWESAAREARQIMEDQVDR
ncbi:MAG: hypothetical protein KDA93_06605 [Planctomycetaceae bacterium]|nr:hypothetical protein [Planctomycetaceae bacterium]